MVPKDHRWVYRLKSLFFIKCEMTNFEFQEFGEEAFDVLDAGWKQKIRLLEEGQLVSGLLIAEKI